MEQNFTILQAAKKISCSKHQQPISLICISDKCQQRLFCLQCFEGDEPTDHIMINIKKFNQLYQKFKKIYAKQNNSQKKVRDIMKDFRNKVNLMIDQIEKNAISLASSIVQLNNGQQQEIRGKMLQIVNKPIWRKVLKYKKQNKSQDQIQDMISKNQEINTKKLFEDLQIIQKNVQLKLKDGISILSANNGSKIMDKSLIKLNQCVFSKNLKHASIAISQSKRIAKGTVQAGHYFALAQDQITSQNSKRDFLIKSYGKFESASLWIGITNLKAAQKNKFQNLYEQGKQSDFIVLYDGGKSVNTWGHYALNAIKSLEGQKMYCGIRVRVQLDYRRKTVKIYTGYNDKDMILFDQHKAFALKDLHAAIGFYGDGQIQYL